MTIIGVEAVTRLLPLRAPRGDFDLRKKVCSLCCDPRVSLKSECMSHWSPKFSKRGQIVNPQNWSKAYRINDFFPSHKFSILWTCFIAFTGTCLISVRYLQVLLCWFWLLGACRHSRSFHGKSYQSCKGCRCGGNCILFVVRTRRSMTICYALLSVAICVVVSCESWTHLVATWSSVDNNIIAIYAQQPFEFVTKWILARSMNALHVNKHNFKRITSVVPNMLDQYLALQLPAVHAPNSILISPPNPCICSCVLYQLRLRERHIEIEIGHRVYYFGCNMTFCWQQHIIATCAQQLFEFN